MDKWALITGASGEIGSAIAKVLAQEGYHLYLHYFQNRAAALALANLLPTETIVVQADLSAEKGATKLLSQIDINIRCLVHCSGTTYYGLMTDIDDEVARGMVQQQVMSPYLLTKGLLPAMISAKQGHIMFITSIWGQIGASCETLYSMVKGGQNALVKALAKEVAPSGVYVNGVAPGAIETKMLADFSDQEKQKLAEDIPMGRLGRPEEVANVVRFLISSEASYLNGQILAVNGAWV